MGIRKSAKVWASVSAAALLTTGALSACGDNAEVERDGQNGSSVGADHETPAELPAELAGEGNVKLKPFRG